MTNTSNSTALTVYRSSIVHCLRDPGDDDEQAVEYLADGLLLIRNGVVEGSSFSMLQTLAEAYKVAQLSGQSLSPQRALYLATLGGAEALYIDDKVGNLAVGKEADFVVIDWECTPLMARRTRTTQDWKERLFALFMLGDDRAIEETVVNGECAYRR